MIKKDLLFAILLFALITAIFFYKFLIYGHVPFPGDLLTAEYNPWKTYSYLGYNPGSYPNKAQYFDVLRQLYPWKTLSISQIASGNIPLWNPYNFSGAPLLANFQSAVFYPLNILYRVLPQIWAWSALVVLQPFLAAIFTFLYARKIGISKTGSVFAGVSFAFSSFMSAWLEYNTIGHVILWLPLLLFSAENLIENKEIKWKLLFVFSLIASLFAGHVQIFAYLLCFLILYLVYRSLYFGKNIGGNLLLFSVLIILSLGIGSIQLIPGTELLKESARSYHPYEFLINKILIQPWQLIMFFVPDFFGNPATRNYWLSDTYVGKVTSIGLVSVFFVLISIFSKQNKFKNFYVLTSLLVLIFSTRNPLTEILYKFQIPLISSSSPTLGIFLFCFGVSILAGIGVDRVKNQNLNLRKYFYYALSICSIFLFSYIILLFLSKQSALLQEQFRISTRNLFYSSLILSLSTILLFLAVLSKRFRYAFLVLLLILNISDLFRAFEKFNPFSPKDLVFPNTSVFKFIEDKGGINRFWGYGYGSVDANFATEYKLFSPDGYDPLYPKRYGEFIQSSKDGKIRTIFTNQSRSDAQIMPGLGKEDLSSNYYRLRVLDLLSVKYILDREENGSTEKTFPIDRFKLVYQKDGWKIFENLKAAPRIFLASDYKIFKNNEEFEKLLFSKDFDPSKTILLEKNILNRELKHINSGEDRLKIITYEPEKITISSSAKNDRLLFLSDTYYPGWKAYVDGNKTEIYRADYAFRAVIVPEGTHTVQFIFDPDSYKLGYKISLISSGLLLLFFLFSIKRFKADI
ncbi:MAG: YfhO family protein [Patescibacteria group bacterium]